MVKDLYEYWFLTRRAQLAAGSSVIVTFFGTLLLIMITILLADKMITIEQVREFSLILYATMALFGVVSFAFLVECFMIQRKIDNLE